MSRQSKSFPKCLRPPFTPPDQSSSLTPATPPMFSIEVVYHYTGLKTIPVSHQSQILRVSYRNLSFPRLIRLVNLIDPFYSAAALHFDNLFERYGAPVYVLNLVKVRVQKRDTTFTDIPFHSLASERHANPSYLRSSLMLLHTLISFCLVKKR